MTTSAATTTGVTTDRAVELRTARGGATLSRVVVVVVLGLLVVGQLTAVPSWWTWGLVGVGLLVGLPHGAVDHLVLARLSARPTGVVVAVYALGAAAALAVLTWGGTVAVVVVVLLSIVHFGQGELESARATGAWTGGRAASAALAVAGTAALLLPLARGGPAVDAVTGRLAPELVGVLADPVTRSVLVAGWALAAAVAVTVALRTGSRTVLLDLGLVAALALLAPPLVAFAVWFGGWHAVRHSARLLTVEPRCAALVEQGRPGAALRRLAVLSTAPTLAALVVLAVLAVRTAGAPDPAAATAVAVRVLLALTVPHVLVVAWWDRTRAGGQSTRTTSTRSTR